MGVSSPKINERIIPKNIFQVSRSVCKIMTPNNSLGSGFLIKFLKGEENFFCLISPEHIITKKLIEQKEKIIFYYDNESKIKEIILDQNKRFIKVFKDANLDATIIEIIKPDNINEDYFLLPNINYMNNLLKLNNEKIQIVQFPRGGNVLFSEGRITEINKFELIYKCISGNASSGSPLILKNTTNVIGINKKGISKTKENYADSIGPIFNFIKNGFIYMQNEEKNMKEIIEEDEEDKLINNKEDKKIQKKIDELFNDDFFEKKYKLFNYISYYDDNSDFPLKNLLNYFLSQKDSPCILKINSDNGLVEFINKKGNNQFLKIEEFFQALKNNSEKNKCLYHPNSLGIIYCFKCQRYLCFNCLKNESEDHLNNNCININKLGNTCLIHNKETKICCKSCEKNFCEECFDKFHKYHEEMEIGKEKITKAKKEIIEKNKKLNKIKEFYDMIQLAYESDPGNPIYGKNVINVGKLIEIEKGRNEIDKDLAIYRIEQMEKNINVNI